MNHEIEVELIEDRWHMSKNDQRRFDIMMEQFKEEDQEPRRKKSSHHKRRKVTRGNNGSANALP